MEPFKGTYCYLGDNFNIDNDYMHQLYLITYHKAPILTKTNMAQTMVYDKGDIVNYPHISGDVPRATCTDVDDITERN